MEGVPLVPLCRPSPIQGSSIPFLIKEPGGIMLTTWTFSLWSDATRSSPLQEKTCLCCSWISLWSCSSHHEDGPSRNVRRLFDPMMVILRPIKDGDGALESHRIVGV